MIGIENRHLRLKSLAFSCGQGAGDVEGYPGRVSATSSAPTTSSLVYPELKDEKAVGDRPLDLPT